ncbi:MAG: FkbM family methyltransferase [Geobacteraceae bacterium]|nr:FkbM family methyltransferase [Geobacteraceae bacterium]
MFVTKSPLQVVRSGILYELDLSEGIDLSIFLLGSFQKHVYKNKLLQLSGEMTILDVGANIGSMALMFAKLFPAASIHAFEPTEYACVKFRRNLELNPELANRITLLQNFVSDCASPNPDIKAYASWKVSAGKELAAQHPVHCGTLKAADGVAAVTLDGYCAAHTIQNIRLIKIDTDGHECQVLLGAQVVIREQRPYLLFEVGGYVMAEQGIEFSWYLDYFAPLDYRLYDSSTNRPINEQNWREIIPQLGTIDILAVPGDMTSRSSQ